MDISKSFGEKLVGYYAIDTLTKKLNLQSLYSNKSSKKCYILISLKKGSTITIDFTVYSIEVDTLYFFNSEQSFLLHPNSKGKLIYFNAEFYCIAFHDNELTCDGVLFNNIYNTPCIIMNNKDSVLLDSVLSDIKSELSKNDFWVEEMIRTRIKELIIITSRIWLIQNPNQKGLGTTETEISRMFSHLVEDNFFKLHTVADYATLLHMSAKTLNRKIVNEKGISPNALIKNRIILQAQRLLVNTSLTVKEISSQLGYKDQSYFIRFFKSQTKKTPLEFRSNQE